MKTITAWLAAALTLSACTVVVSPGLGRHQQLEIIRVGQGPAPASSQAFSLPTEATPVLPVNVDSPATSAPRCGTYVRPEHPAMPILPTFSEQEGKDPKALANRLGGYITELRNFILAMDKLDNDAYAKYQQSCNPLPAGPAS